MQDDLKMSVIDYQYFSQIEIRVGLVIKAAAPDWSKKLLLLKVDFGPELGERTILAGIQKWYRPDDLLNRKFPFVANLAERKMGPAVSQGMMLMADGKEKPCLLALDQDLTPGSRLR